MDNIPSFRILFEKIKAEKEEIKQIKLPVERTALEPVLSKNNIDLHYGTLYKNYVKKALAGDGDFQVAGAVLHTLFFEQFCEPKTINKPFGPIDLLISEKFGNYEKFKDSFIEIALGIQGSGWAYLDYSGNIKTIKNHKVVSNVAILIDMWEHSYLEDYKSDKEKYLRNIWKIIDWKVINMRID
jgi:Fe-Mn family superoxide dismutase